MSDTGIISFLGAAVAHFYYPSLTTKCLPIWLLALRCMMLSEHQVPDRTIAYGLIVSSMGDASLWLETADGVADNLREPLFMIGLVCFLVAHILYIKAMLGHTSFHTKWLSLPIFVYYTTMMYVILPAAPEELGLPIMIYGLAISVMGYAALNFWHNCVSPAWQMATRLRHPKYSLAHYYEDLQARYLVITPSSTPRPLLRGHVGTLPSYHP